MILSTQSKILMTLLILALLFPAITGILAIVPLNPAEVRSITVTNPDKEVLAGTPMYYMVDSTKHTNRPCRIIRQLINERTIHYTPIYSNVPVGTKKRSGYLSTAENDMPGEYYMRWTAIYTYFYFREVVVVVDSDKFVIVKPETLQGKTGKQGTKGEKGDTGGIRFFSKGDNK
jgi:hypothetical protein